jgi:hypothetical protein
LRVRWTSRATVARDTLAAATAKVGAELVEAGAREARVRVSDDEAAARLIHELVSGGVPVVEVVPEESRLERLFVEPGAPRGAAERVVAPELGAAEGRPAKGSA